MEEKIQVVRVYQRQENGMYDVQFFFQNGGFMTKNGTISGKNQKFKKASFSVTYLLNGPLLGTFKIFNQL